MLVQLLKHAYLHNCIKNSVDHSAFRFNAVEWLVIVKDRDAINIKTLN